MNGMRGLGGFTGGGGLDKNWGEAAPALQAARPSSLGRVRKPADWHLYTIEVRRLKVRVARFDKKVS